MNIQKAEVLDIFWSIKENNNRLNTGNIKGIVIDVYKDLQVCILLENISDFVFGFQKKAL